MKLIVTDLPRVFVLEPRVFEDDRGFFMESYRVAALREAGLPHQFTQENHSGSRQNVLRGLHYQIDHAQAKLVRAVVGEIFDVAVDLDRSSPTFGQWTGAILSAANRRQLLIHPHCAHGFYVLSDWAEVTYKVTDIYSPEHERTLMWNDPSVGIEWPMDPTTEPLISDKDARGDMLSEAEVFESATSNETTAS